MSEIMEKVGKITVSYSIEYGGRILDSHSKEITYSPEHKSTKHMFNKDRHTVNVLVGYIQQFGIGEDK